MLALQTLTLIGLLASGALASPMKRQTSAVQNADCGGRMYAASDIYGATSRGLELLREGKTVGQVFGPKYPNPWHNPDDLPVTGAGPWWEFPLVAGDIYSDDSEDSGVDRSVFNAQGELVAVVAATEPETADPPHFVACETS